MKVLTNLFIVYSIVERALEVNTGWVDPDTPNEAKFTTSQSDGRTYEMVFSDEFEVEDRAFDDGSDPRWTAIHKDDYTNYALQFYNKNLAKTSGGFLNISTVIEDITFDVKGDALKDPHATGKLTKKTKNYQSAMIQGWNKFCFTGGIIEVSSQLPGDAYIGGLWPAMWMLGNLARATYVGSSNNVWPWSYNSCDKKLQSKQTVSACNKVNHYDLHPHQGRGAPEIDILEAMPGHEKLKRTTTARPFFSTSLQVAPGRKNRPDSSMPPEKGMWYEDGITYGKNSSQNIFFYGMHLQGVTKDKSYDADAISSNTNLERTHFEDQHIYRTEWVPGPEGYIRWYLDGEFLYGLEASALNSTGAIIPEEPMYIILNTAISSTWGFPSPCPEGCDCDCFDCRLEECSCGVPANMCKNFPSNMLIDYVRVYQAVGDDGQIVGCSTPTHPTKRYINGHKDQYMSDSDTVMLKQVTNGGGLCKTTSQCGGEGAGACIRGRCVCTDRSGPNCKSHIGFDDIVWDKDEDIEFYLFAFPRSFLLWVLVVLIVLVVVVILKYYNEKHIRLISGVNDAIAGSHMPGSRYNYSPIQGHDEPIVAVYDSTGGGYQ